MPTNWNNLNSGLQLLKEIYGGCSAKRGNPRFDFLLGRMYQEAPFLRREQGWVVHTDIGLFMQPATGTGNSYIYHQTFRDHEHLSELMRDEILTYAEDTSV